jgi:hypothetical protein
MRRLFGLLFVLTTVTVSCNSDSSPTPSSGTSRSQAASASPNPDSPYVLGFRHAYLPIVTTLNAVTIACVRSDMSVALLPACGKRVTAFQAAVARLARYVTTTAPPASAAAATRSLAASMRDMQRAFTALAVRIKHQDLAGFLAMGGLGGPIDMPITAFVGAVGTLDAEFPGESFPLPG